MTHPEFMQQDLELQQQIAFYRSDSAMKQAEIAMNERAIIELEQQRCVLRKEYAESEYKKPVQMI